METPIITLSFFKYSGLNKFWAFTMMQFAHKYLKNTPGLTFYKLLGTGAGNGFSLKPDFSVYAFLGVWEDEESAEKFIHSSDLFKQYDNHSIKRWLVWMRPIKSHGLWSGVNPFKPELGTNPGELLAVITRATIDKKQLIKFWRRVPGVSAILKDQKGLVFSKGIGEWPFIQMATFSIWKDEESLRKYAYQSPQHLDAIKKTRELNWYTEELFARFAPYKEEGERLFKKNA